MCGFVCLFNPGVKEFTPEVLRSMTDALSHRGPDDYSYSFIGRECRKVWREVDPAPFQAAGVAMGHRRLSILDLSSSGRQPFSSPDERFWMVYNGEIYNYLELRKELVSLGYSFTTGTDTEVVLTAFREWGPDCVNRFNGMWALVIWDNKSQTLFASKDRFGIKPLFYCKIGETWLFASEIKALLQHNAVNPCPDDGHLFRYFYNDDTPEKGETFFQNIKSFRPAHSLTIQGERSVEKAYWQLPNYENNPDLRSIGEKAEYFRELLMDSVQLQLRSDVPVGTMLSGGLDSASIAASVESILSAESVHDVARERQRAISSCYPGMWNDETDKIDELGRALNIDITKMYPAEADVSKYFDRVIGAIEEPFNGTMPIVQDLMMARAKAAGIKVTLNGHGPDEMFAGYPARHCSFVAANYFGSGHFGKGIREVRGMRKHHNITYPDLIYTFLRVHSPHLGRLAHAVHHRKQRSFLSAEARKEHGESAARFRESSIPGRSALDRRLRREFFDEIVPRYLAYEDRVSMASSIESRVPFLDHRLVEFAFGLADRDRIMEGQSKYVMREAMKDYLPNSITAEHQKRYIEGPFVQWLQGPLRGMVKETLLADNPRIEKLIDQEKFSSLVKRVVEGSEKGNREQNLVWRALTAELWLRKFF